MCGTLCQSPTCPSCCVQPAAQNTKTLLKKIISRSSYLGGWKKQMFDIFALEIAEIINDLSEYVAFLS